MRNCLKNKNMKKLITILAVLTIYCSLFGQQVDKHYGDVLIYGNIKILNNPASTNYDSTTIPYVYVDSMNLAGTIIRYVAGDSIPNFDWVRNTLSSYKADSAVFSDTANVALNIAGVNIIMPDTLVNKHYVDSLVFNNDSVLFAFYSDTANFADTALFAWLAQNATYSDTANFADTAGYAAVAAFALNSMEIIEILPRTIYVETTGSDLTGDGTSIGTAYATFNKALQDIGTHIRANITIKFGVGSFEYAMVDRYLLDKKIVVNGAQLLIQGEFTDELTGFSLTPDGTNPFLYTMSGQTMVAGDYDYGFLLRSGTYYPIMDNTTTQFESFDDIGTGTALYNIGTIFTNPDNSNYLLNLFTKVDEKSGLEFQTIYFSTTANYYVENSNLFKLRYCRVGETFDLEEYAQVIAQYCHIMELVSDASHDFYQYCRFYSSTTKIIAIKRGNHVFRGALIDGNDSGTGIHMNDASAFNNNTGASRGLYFKDCINAFSLSNANFDGKVQNQTYLSNVDYLIASDTYTATSLSLNGLINSPDIGIRADGDTNNIDIDNRFFVLYGQPTTYSSMSNLNLTEGFTYKGADIDSIMPDTVPNKAYVDNLVADNDSVNHAEYSDTSKIAIALASVNSDLIMYVDSVAGVDNDECGGIGSPCATLLQAVKNTPKLIVSSELTYSIESGGYNITTELVEELGLITFNNSNINFTGTYEVVIPSVLFSTIPDWPLHYDASKAGVTLVEDSLKGLFVQDGAKYYPIGYNEAGSDNFQVDFTPGNKAGTKDIVKTNTRFYCEDDFSLDLNLSGNPTITFSLVDVIYPGNAKFNNNWVYISWDWGTRIKTATGLLYSTYGDSKIFQTKFRGVYLYGSTTDLMSFRNENGANILIQNSVFDNSLCIYDHVGGIGAVGKLLAISTVNGYFIGAGNGMAIRSGRGSQINLKQYNEFKDFDGAFDLTWSVSKMTSTSANDPSICYFNNTPYVFNYSGESNVYGYQVYIDSIYHDANFLGVWQPGFTDTSYVNLEKQNFISVSGYTPYINKVEIANGFTYKGADIDSIMPDTVPNKAYVDNLVADNDSTINMQGGTSSTYYTANLSSNSPGYSDFYWQDPSGDNWFENWSSIDNVSWQLHNSGESTTLMNLANGTTPTLRVDLKGLVAFQLFESGLVLNNGITLGSSSSTDAGTLRWTGTAFEGYDGVSWGSLGGGDLTFSEGLTESGGTVNFGGDITSIRTVTSNTQDTIITIDPNYDYIRIPTFETYAPLYRIAETGFIVGTDTNTFFPDNFYNSFAFTPDITFPGGGGATTGRKLVVGSYRDDGIQDPENFLIEAEPGELTIGVENFDNNYRSEYKQYFNSISLQTTGGGTYSYLKVFANNISERILTTNFRTSYQDSTIYAHKVGYYGLSVPIVDDKQFATKEYVDDNSGGSSAGIEGDLQLSDGAGGFIVSSSVTAGTYPAIQTGIDHTLLDDAVSYINVGDVTQNGLIIINATFTRGSSVTSAVITIDSDGENLWTTWYPYDAGFGLTFTNATLSGNTVQLHYTTTDTGTAITMNANYNRVMK